MRELPARSSLHLSWGLQFVEAGWAVLLVGIDESGDLSTTITITSSCWARNGNGRALKL